ncbi:MAG TPA: SpoIIE family protein phosphatase, partial [Anaerolineales bacterium]|nr:SpoIIE family protein phosphatase [Anaerolineales bacterium]
MSPPRILIVDDEPLNIDYLQQELETPEFVTLTASNGQEALDRVSDQSPDLILLDIMMPVMDGFETLRRLKADAATRNLPVIIISAASDINSVVKGIQLGAEDYLPKPFEPTLLRARISSSLEKKRLHDLEQMYLKGLERELDIAREIQEGFLPAELPQVPGWELAAYFRAAREVAGDFYDAFVLPDGRLVCLVGDVCGKGVGAALFMTLFRSLLRASFTSGLASHSEGDGDISSSARIRQVVTFTSNYVAETHAEANMFATVFMGVFDPGDGTLTYVNCGNEAPVLLSGGAITLLGPTGPVIGVIPGAAFGVKQISLQKGDLLLAFTDGITDATNTQDEIFGREQLTSVLGQVGTSPEAVLVGLETGLAEFVG